MAKKDNKKTVINLTPEYYIEVDNLNWTVFRAPSEDRKTPTLIGYYVSFDGAVKGMLRKGVVNAENQGEFNDVKSYIGNVEKLLDNAVKQFKEVYNGSIS